MKPFSNIYLRVCENDLAEFFGLISPTVWYGSAIGSTGGKKENCFSEKVALI